MNSDSEYQQDRELDNLNPQLEIAPPTINGSDLPLDNWNSLLEDFLKYHQNPLNKFLHLLSTPLGLLAILALAQNASDYVPIAICSIYALSLLGRLPYWLWTATTIVLASLAWLAISISPSILVSLIMLPSAYILQDIAHWVTGEKSYQSSYTNQQNWLSKFIKHSYYLLPLVLASVAHNPMSMWRWLVARDTVMDTKLQSEREQQDLAMLKTWIEGENPSKIQTTHWWRNDLTETVQKSFDNIAYSSTIQAMFHNLYPANIYTVEVIDGMNEVYVTAPHRNISSSDNVFYLSHTDAPFLAIFPFATVFRCMVAVNSNDWVHTHFPMRGTSFEDPHPYTLTTGDVVAFDYIHELHYITATPDELKQNLRLNLKVHYLVYPTLLRPYGKFIGYLANWYNQQGRNAFLGTQTTESPLSKMLVGLLFLWTKTVDLIGRYVGPLNLTYVILLAAIAIVFKNNTIFLVGTSFIHYLIYLATYYYRQNVSYGTFIRDAVFFKSLSMLQLVFWYFKFFEFNFISFLSLAIAVSGFYLAVLAYEKLGHVRSYFGVELGKIEPEKISSFPYNFIPHPMIIGNIINLLGLYLLEPFRIALPWLVPVHIAFYTIHLIQEILDLHERSDDRLSM
jgi:Phospholipid methyltransferase